MSITQADRFITVETPLGEDALVLLSFQGDEAISQPFRFSLEMVANDPAINILDLVGANVTFKVPYGVDDARFFNGKILRASAGAIESTEDGEIRRVNAEVVPNFWFQKFQTDCRIFQNKTIPDIIKQLWSDRGVPSSDYGVKLKGKFEKLEYCVQYNESDYQFVTRLMEEAGIYYYFVHEDGSHKMTLGDTATTYADCKQSEVEFQARFGEMIQSWEHQLQFTSGKFTQTDYNFTDRDTQLVTKEKTNLKTAGIDKFEVYEYPGYYSKMADGKPLAVARIEELEAPHEIVFGKSICPSWFPGGKFKIKSHPVKSEANKSYVLTSVAHKAYEPSLDIAAEEEERDDTAPVYSNSFQCIPSKMTYRPPRVTPKPRIHGLQTAKVVGAKGKEIDTDKYGRVRVQFHWDREGKFNDKSSCFVRVAQAWAGNKWGLLFTPRVGDEVVVDFLDGDPDRPLIIGSVYNNVNMPPYKLPDKAAHSGIKTFTTEKGKAKQFNELRFEDTKDKELIYFHAQHNFERVVENDDKLKVGFDKKDKGNQAIDIYNDRTVTIDKGIDTLHVKSKDRVLKVDKGNHLITIKTGDQKIEVGSGNHKLHVKSGKSETQAAQKILLKVGGSSIEITPSDIKISATNVTINADANAKMKGGAQATVEGGAMANLKAGGPTNVKGAIVNIN